MSAVNFNEYKRRLGVPFVLLLLALLALLVALFGLVKTTSISAERMQELQISWQAIEDGPPEGSELVATDRLMDRAVAPVPAVQSAARWSLALAVVSLVLLSWVVVLAIRAGRMRLVEEHGLEQNEQAAVLKLMDEIAPLASGDLRVRATVTDSMTGSLADAFNYAISELRWLVGTLSSSATQVTESIERSRASAKVVEDACAEQSSEIHQSSNHLLSMSGAMAELSADANESSEAVQAAADQAGKGAEALQASLQRLSTIRDGVENSVRLMRRLAENAATIDERISNLDDVAKNTDLLALNTTIRASTGSSANVEPDSSTELGRLSDEVAQLSGVLGRATRDIGSLTGTIAQDAAEAVRLMESTSTELAFGLEQTAAATDILQAIHDDSRLLNERMVSMGSRTVEQSGIVRKLSENMDAINQITGQTVNEVSTNVESLDTLQELASELRQTLSDFRLPSRPAAGAAVNSTGDSVTTKDKTSQARRAANRAVIHE